MIVSAVFASKNVAIGGEEGFTVKKVIGETFDLFGADELMMMLWKIGRRY